MYHLKDGDIVDGEGRRVTVYQPTIVDLLNEREASKHQPAKEPSVPVRVLGNLFAQLDQRGWDRRTLEHLRICLLSKGFTIDRRSPARD